MICSQNIYKPLRCISSILKCRVCPDGPGTHIQKRIIASIQLIFTLKRVLLTSHSGISHKEQGKNLVSLSLLQILVVSHEKSDVLTPSICSTLDTNAQQLHLLYAHLCSFSAQWLSNNFRSQTANHQRETQQPKFMSNK